MKAVSLILLPEMNPMTMFSLRHTNYQSFIELSRIFSFCETGGVNNVVNLMVNGFSSFFHKQLISRNQFLCSNKFNRILSKKSWVHILYYSHHRHHYCNYYSYCHLNMHFSRPYASSSWSSHPRTPRWCNRT